MGGARLGRGLSALTLALAAALAACSPAAEAGRAEEQHMIHRLAPPARGLDKHPQILARARLADEFAERFGPQRGVGIVRLTLGGMEGLVSHCGVTAGMRFMTGAVRVGGGMDAETSSA